MISGSFSACLRWHRTVIAVRPTRHFLAILGEPRVVLEVRAEGAPVTAHLDPGYRMEKPVIRIKNNAVRAVLIVVVGCTAVIALVYGLFTYTNVQQLIGDLVWHPGTAISRPWRSRRKATCWQG